MLKNYLVKENNISYYNIPVGYKLFKATKEYTDNDSCEINLKPGFYFFGEHGTDPEYIKSYEELYGIIYEFQTTREYKLVALDDKNTQQFFYTNAPLDIQNILKQNYGYKDNIRNSVAEKDKKISEYLCENGYDGYAIQSMDTDFGGKFHPELMVCNVSGIRCLGRITNDKRVKEILDEDKLKRLANEMKNKRNTRNIDNNEHDIDNISNNTFSKRLFFGFNEEDEDDNKSSSPKKLNRSLFGDGGAKKRKTTKKNSRKKLRKTRKNRKTKNNKKK